MLSPIAPFLIVLFSISLNVASSLECISSAEDRSGLSSTATCDSGSNACFVSGRAGTIEPEKLLFACAIETDAANPYTGVTHAREFLDGDGFVIQYSCYRDECNRELPNSRCNVGSPPTCCSTEDGCTYRTTKADFLQADASTLDRFIADHDLQSKLILLVSGTLVTLIGFVKYFRSRKLRKARKKNRQEVQMVTFQGTGRNSKPSPSSALVMQAVSLRV